MNSLTYDEIVAGVRPIVEADPHFIYPQQAEHNEDERCSCVEVDADQDFVAEFEGEYYLYEDCSWHMDDDNTCRYVQDNGAPACVVGHYFAKELGFDDLVEFETKSPLFILNCKGYDVDERGQRFLNMIQSQQDQGWEWQEAFKQAVASAEGEPIGKRFV